MSRHEHHPRFEMHLCGLCRMRTHEDELRYDERLGEYLCEVCLDEQADRRANAWNQTLGAH